MQIRWKQVQKEMPLSHYRCATWFSGITHTIHIHYKRILSANTHNFTHTHSQTVVFRVIYKVQKCSPSTTGASTMVATANVSPGYSEIMKHQFRVPPLWPLIGIVFWYTADRYRCWNPDFLEAARYISWPSRSPANWLRKNKHTKHRNSTKSTKNTTQAQ